MHAAADLAKCNETALAVIPPQVLEDDSRAPIEPFGCSKINPVLSEIERPLSLGLAIGAQRFHRTQSINEPAVSQLDCIYNLRCPNDLGIVGR
jgi:hypothetical protein